MGRKRPSKRSLMGNEPEAYGLAALISLSMSRANARDSGDAFVPLEEQDTTLWSRELPE